MTKLKGLKHVVGVQASVDVPCVMMWVDGLCRPLDILRNHQRQQTTGEELTTQTDGNGGTIPTIGEHSSSAWTPQMLAVVYAFHEVNEARRDEAT